MRVRNLKPLTLFLFFWHVKESPSNRIALKTDVIRSENILFSGASVHHSARNFTGWDSEGVNLSTSEVGLFTTVSRVVSRCMQGICRVWPGRREFSGIYRVVWFKQEFIPRQNTNTSEWSLAHQQACGL